MKTRHVSFEILSKLFVLSRNNRLVSQLLERNERFLCHFAIILRVYIQTFVHNYVCRASIFSRSFPKISCCNYRVDVLPASTINMITLREHELHVTKRIKSS